MPSRAEAVALGPMARISFFFRLQGDGQTDAGGGEAAHAQDGVEGVEAGAGQQADLQHVEDVVDAGEGDDGPEEAYDQAADT